MAKVFDRLRPKYMDWDGLNIGPPASKSNGRQKPFETGADCRFKWTWVPVANGRRVPFQMEMGHQIKLALTAKQNRIAHPFEKSVDFLLKLTWAAIWNGCARWFHMAVCIRLKWTSTSILEAHVLPGRGWWGSHRIGIGGFHVGTSCWNGFYVMVTCGSSGAVQHSLEASPPPLPAAWEKLAKLTNETQVNNYYMDSW